MEEPPPTEAERLSFMTISMYFSSMPFESLTPPRRQCESLTVALTVLLHIKSRTCCSGRPFRLARASIFRPPDSETRRSLACIVYTTAHQPHCAPRLAAASAGPRCSGSTLASTIFNHHPPKVSIYIGNDHFPPVSAMPPIHPHCFPSLS